MQKTRLREPADGPETVVMHFRAEDQVRYDMTYAQLSGQVASVAHWLRSVGVERVIGSPLMLPTCRKLWLPCWLPPALGRSGHPPHRILGRIA
ncbi:MAG: hypothetical protein R3E89_05455 [Thiolinea sp.]